jgi:nitroreductase
MEVFKAIAERYSYRGGFKPGRMSRGILKRIVSAGLKAPSACNEQTTTFVIADGEKQLAQLRQLHPMQAMQDARAVIACVTSKKPRPVYHKWSFEAEDCAAAIMNMWLAATALGFATVWIDGHVRIGNRAEKYNRILGIPPGRTVRVILPLGRPVGKGPRRKKKPFSERAWFNRHGR